MCGKWQIKEKKYGDLYQEHILEQYKLYVEFADRISQRRADANTFFLTINTLIVTGLGLLNNSVGRYSIVIAILGSVLSITWYFILKSYRMLNSGKFKVIHEIEEQLPMALYKHEWEILGGGKDKTKYWPISHIEKIVPLVFVLAYITLAVITNI